MTPLKGLFLVISLGVVSTAQAQELDFSGDMRFGFASFDRDERNGTEIGEDVLRLRARAGVLWTINENWSFKGRYAARLNNKNNESGWVKLFDGLNVGATSIVPGESTLDEFFVRARYGKWDHRIGRFQTNNRMIGVAAKGLSRFNSAGWDVNSTDGIQTVYRTDLGFNVTGIIEYNNKDGASNVRRAPLDFSDSSSRAGYFLALDAQDNSGLWAQRSIDVAYIPAALYPNGIASGQNRGYVGFSGRAVTQFALQGEMKLLTGLELAWAPDTQSKAVARVPGTGKADSFSWHTSINLQDFVPGHSISLVYGENEAGWLLSADFPTNTAMTEVRYDWEVMSGHLLEARVRDRTDLQQQTNAVQKRSEVDVYVRYTISL
jgi:hypothetical protein